MAESGPEGATLVFTLDDFEIAPIEGTEYAEIRAFGLFAAGPAGAPALPVKSAALVVPHGAEVSVRVLSEDSEWIGGVTPAPRPTERVDDEGAMPRPVAELIAGDEYYSAGAVYPPAVVRVEEMGSLRGHRIVSVVFGPFRYHAGRNGLEVRRKITARVRFEGGSIEAPGPIRSGDRRWAPVLEGLLLNYERGARWRKAPSPSPARDEARSQAAAELKLKVTESSLYRVRYEELAEAGLPEATDTSDLRLFERAYSSALGSTVETEIPIAVDDLGSDGTFGPGDSFIFYGLSYWDRFPEKFAEGPKSRPHVYWLSIAEAGGARMGETGAWGEFSETQTPSSFAESVHLHEDHIMNHAPYDPDVILFWFNDMLKDEAFPFVTPSPDPDEPFGVRIRFQPRHPSTHAVSAEVINGEGAVEAVAERGLFTSFSYKPGGKIPYTFQSGLIGEPGFLSDGENSLRIVGERLSSGTFVPGIRAFLDWFEIVYSRRYEAWADTVTFTAGPSESPLHLEVGGFTSPGLVAFDVTDPLAPGMLALDERNIVEAGGAYELAIRGRFPDSRRIASAAAEAVRRLDRSEMELDSPSNLRGEGAGADYLIVVYDDFADEVVPLVQLRESQGFQVAVARSSDVYDEFGDGYKSPEAIKNYFIHGYNNWGAAYGLLVGDAGEDRESSLTGIGGERTDPDLVPSYHIRHDGVDTAPLGPELVNSDSWYGTQLDGNTGDWLPDMFVGRLPAGSARQARDMVNKIVAYESYEGAESWRSRGLLVSDDDYSASVFFNAQYCRQSLETQTFEPISIALSELLEDEEQGVPGFEAPAFKLRSYLWAYPDSAKAECYGGFDLIDVQDYTRAKVTPVLVDTMSMGWLFVNYQGHGNEELWAHEFLFSSSQFGAADDVTSLGNTGRPFVLMAYSCHVADFDDENEVDRGDCMGERMLFLPEAGAVGVYASTGYEYLSTAPFNVPILRSFIADPPVEDDIDEVHIRLGPALAKGEIEWYMTASSTGRWALRTFSLLGDPATRIDAAPPRITATLGDSLLEDGGALVDPSGADTLRLHFEIRDEVAVDSTSIFVKETWRRTEGADSTYDVPLSELGISRGRQGRLYGFDYTVRLLPSSMELTAGAVDRNGRRSTISLRATLSALWNADGRPLSDEDLVAATADMSVRVSSPIPIDGSILSVAFDGARSDAFAGRQTDAQGMEWELSAPGFSMEDGAHTFALLVEGRPVRTVTVRVDTRLRFASFIPFPSPCDESGTTFFYELTSTGNVEITEVVLRIYSVAGRRVAELKDMDPAVGRGSIHWPAVDDHGERVANGVYICRAVAVGTGGRKASVLEKVAVAR